TSFNGALNALQKLLALEDAIIVRAENFEIGSAAGGSPARTADLLDLKIVVFVHDREQETRVVHRSTNFPCKGMIGRYPAFREDNRSNQRCFLKLALTSEHSGQWVRMGSATVHDRGLRVWHDRGLRPTPGWLSANRREFLIRHGAVPTKAGGIESGVSLVKIGLET